MISNILTGLTVLLLFGLTIFVHELGHFLVARWCGMVVDTFSIGFGPAILQRKVNGVLYKIGIFPLGGYVSLPQMDPSGGNPEPEKDGDAARDLPRLAPWKKILVGLAGVTGNMILAFFLACLMFWCGKSFAPDQNNIVGFVQTNSTAYADGFRIGDEIEAVNGRGIKTWEDFMVGVTLSRELVVQVRRSTGEVVDLQPATESMMEGRLVPGIYPLNYCRVLRVIPGSSADAAGLETGDRIAQINGARLYSREQLVEYVNLHPDQPIALQIERKGILSAVNVTPRIDKELNRALIGVEFNTFDVKKPWPQIKSFAVPIFRILKALVTPNEAKVAASQLGGPWLIFEQFWFAVKASFILAMWFTAMLNVNLAILNLLPIPVLDGGHIMFTLWGIVARRPVGPRVVNVVWNAFALLLISVFLLLTFRDVRRTFRRAGDDAKTPAAAAVTNAPTE